MNIQIVHLENVVPVFGTIKSHTLNRLTAPGDNYGSLILRLDITVENENITSEIHTVAKMVPPNPLIQEMFGTQATFRNEISFYKIIVPVLQQFQRDHGLEAIFDCVPKYFGSRLNLDNDELAKVDENAILVLENLKIDNFSNFDRKVGLSLAAAKMVLSDLAQLHATPVAFKLEQPELFRKTVLPYLTKRFQFAETMVARMKEQLQETLNQILELKPFEEKLSKMVNNLYTSQKPDETWSTICHNDCWTNNIMVKNVGETPIKTKLVDFQIIDYGSPAKDIVFFLFSSVNSTVLSEHYDELIDWYYSNFIKNLEKLNCNTISHSFDSFLEQLTCEGRNIACAQVFFMTYFIFKPDGAAKDIEELTEADLKDADITDLQKEKLIFIVKQFAQRNWI